ncbi:MAG: molybdenum cofactor biosynthesis protein MoaE [Pseudomonadota bacterium]
MAAVQSAAWQVRVQADAFDVSRELAEMRGADTGIGGIGLFVGTVRDLQVPTGDPATQAGDTAGDGVVHTADDEAAALQALELEHYPGMTERLLADMLDEARRRFALRAGRIVHRVGRLAPGEGIVLVMAAAAHRHAALEACAFLMDWLKTDAPFWKKEHTAAGSRWVDAREADDRALARWGRRSGNAAGPT